MTWPQILALAIFGAAAVVGTFIFYWRRQDARAARSNAGLRPWTLEAPPPAQGPQGVVLPLEEVERRRRRRESH